MPHAFPVPQEPPHHPPRRRCSRPGAGWPRSASTGSSRGGRSVPRHWLSPRCRHGAHRSSRRRCSPLSSPSVAAGAGDTPRWHRGPGTRPAPWLCQQPWGHGAGLCPSRRWLCCSGWVRERQTPLRKTSRVRKQAGRSWEPVGVRLHSPGPSPWLGPGSRWCPPLQCPPALSWTFHAKVTQAPTCPGSVVVLFSSSWALSRVSPCSPVSSYK